MLVSSIDKSQFMKNRKEKILIADDDPAILESLRMMLEIWDYEVESVSDGNVLSKLQKSKPGLLLLDVWMSGVNGVDICKRLKQNPRTKNIPVILFSANSNIKDCTKDSGANDYIEKPFDIAELLGKIEKNLTNKKVVN